MKASVGRLKGDAFINEEGVRISVKTGKPVREYNKKNKAFWNNEPVVVESPLWENLKTVFTEDELTGFVKMKSDPSLLQLVELKAKPESKSGNIGILIASDWHYEETVRASTVLGKNEFNADIAEVRAKNFFVNAVATMKHKPIDELIFGCIGDFIGGFIHEELQQTNSASPMAAISKVKGVLLSGIKYMLDELPELTRMTFIGICGNHSRTTRKMQFANGFDLNHEYFMYKDMQEMCSVLGLSKVEFIIPESEFAYMDVYGKKLLFCHGHQFRSAGGVGGIYPSMFKWFGRMNQVVPIDKAFIGHYHTSIWTKEVCVNGSLKGYDAFAIGKGLNYEEPQQTYCILNESRGFIFYTPIFLY